MRRRDTVYKALCGVGILALVVPLVVYAFGVGLTDAQGAECCSSIALTNSNCTTSSCPKYDCPCGTGNVGTCQIIRMCPEYRFMGCTCPDSCGEGFTQYCTSSSCPCPNNS
jgi:hypothetical protein